MKSIRLDFVPVGSPEINFVLGPSALDIQQKNKLIAPSPISVFDRHTREKNENRIEIKHVQAGGPTITVTKKRANRILKRRKKRFDFLIKHPEYLLPYKFRNHGPKHASRSKSAKNRRRKEDGRFAKVGSRPIDFSIDIDDPAISQDQASMEDVIVRDNI